MNGLNGLIAPIGTEYPLTSHSGHWGTSRTDSVLPIQRRINGLINMTNEVFSYRVHVGFPGLRSGMVVRSMYRTRRGFKMARNFLRHQERANERLMRQMAAQFQKAVDAEVEALMNGGEWQA